jgi:hypothetical protein
LYTTCESAGKRCGARLWSYAFQKTPDPNKSARTMSIRSVKFVSATSALLAQRRQSRLDGFNLCFAFGETVTLLLHDLGTGFAQKISVGKLAP